MQGEEFTQRLLTPFEEQKLTLLLRQGYDVDALLRLMGAEVRLVDAAGNVAVYHNRPSDRDGYTMFRRVVAHLSSIQDLHALNVEPLHFERTWEVPESAITPESFASIYSQFALTRSADGATYVVSKRVNGRVMISNYDPSTLSNDERVRLHAEAEEAPANDILLDILAGPSGRRASAARQVAPAQLPRDPELHRSRHRGRAGVRRRTRSAHRRHPRQPGPHAGDRRIEQTLQATTSSPCAGRAATTASLPTRGYQWNRKAFSLLYQLFQMSVSGRRRPGAGDHHREVARSPTGSGS